MDGECWFDSGEARSQLNDVACTRLPSDALHNPADFPLHFREQEDGNCSPGTVLCLLLGLAGELVGYI